MLVKHCTVFLCTYHLLSLSVDFRFKGLSLCSLETDLSWNQPSFLNIKALKVFRIDPFRWPLPGDEVDIVPDSSLVLGPVLRGRVAPRALRFGGIRVGEVAPTCQQTDDESCKHDPRSLSVGHLRRNAPRFHLETQGRPFCFNPKVIKLLIKRLNKSVWFNRHATRKL